jgi:hypothetical protein
MRLQQRRAFGPIGRAHQVSPESLAKCIALLERENRDRAAGGALSELAFREHKAANDGSLRTDLNNVATHKCA